MKWYMDKSGRFSERPHYQLEELEAMCEDLTNQVLRDRNKGKVIFPIPTEDLQIMIEREGADLDNYVDLSNEGSSVDGVTEFCKGKKPVVKISHVLSEHPGFENRFRTTLSHECSHVKFHGFLWEMKFANGDLFEKKGDKHSCKRETIESELHYDWMEWQANYCMGAILMPNTHLKKKVKEFLTVINLSMGQLDETTEAAVKLIESVALQFGVSEQASRVRLFQAGFIVKNNQNQQQFFA